MTTSTTTLASRVWQVSGSWKKQALLVVLGSLFIAICAQITIHLPLVPVTMQTFAVLMIGATCGANTFPYLQVQNSSSKVEHEATTSKIGEEQLFYFASRGIGAEEAVSMIINGFCRDVFQQLPMEFAVEATKLLGLKLEGSVG